MNCIVVNTANPERLAYDAMADVWTPPPRVDYLKWAEDNIVLSERESPYPGPYNRDLFGYFDEVLRAFSPEDPCRIVTLKKSAQLGGTVLANIFCCGSLAMVPGDFLYVHPTEGNAQRWSKQKLAPMLKNTTSLRALFSQKSRDGGDSILYKERIDGRGAIQISGANSPASLSMVTMKNQVQDDLAKWETNSAGDPEAQADSRSQAHEFAKIAKISTPLILPGCRISRNYEDGSQEQPFVPCPHCGHMQVLEWDNMLANLDEEHPERAHFVCTDPECGGVIEEHHRPAMLKKLEWRTQNEKAKRQHRSFWIWSAYSVLQTFERIARAWLKAKGDPASEQTFMNDVVGQAYNAAGDAPPWEELRDRAAESDYSKGQIPAGAVLITLGIDCQDDRVEWHLVGWDRDLRRYVIDYGVIAGHISEKSARGMLDLLIVSEWKNAYGHKLKPDLTAIDGNYSTADVWGWAKRHPASKVIMVRGARSETAPRLQRVKQEYDDKTGKVKKYSRRFYNFNGSIMKFGLYKNIRKTDPLEPGYVAFASGLDDEYFRGLTAERRVVEKNRDGFDVWKWKKDPTQNNEPLDTMNQAEAAATKYGLRSMPSAVWDRLEAERWTPVPEAQLDLEDLPLAPAPAPTTKTSKKTTTFAGLAKALNG
ncbi:phage terminase large subunit family protein [Roseibium sediminicola]|uniref:Phage terminase large subunit family protein n=1 Tax=Roseibium sediminicola TaxID=2933272 RepID=A0ABT0GRA1_9HYPH|nr:terminase gpA endonuclease subunit [Roseibium sp. CAU 1639]MCK7611976.1 phage terminase large subunit family protein [Roseibium sp. CAU 1639]